MKLLKRKHPILFSMADYEHYRGRWLAPEVIMFGSNGSKLKTFRCKSNKAAIQLRDELIKKLNNFLENKCLNVDS